MKIYLMVVFIFCLSCQKNKHSRENLLTQVYPTVVSGRDAMAFCNLPGSKVTRNSSVFVGKKRLSLATFCQTHHLMESIDTVMRRPRHVQCTSSRSVDYRKAVPISIGSSDDSCLVLPKDKSLKTTLQYCQRNDPKVMNSTGGSCMAMSWYWALAHFKDELAVSVLERKLTNLQGDEWKKVTLEQSEVQDFFNILKNGDTDVINNVQLAIEKSNNKLMRLLKLAETQTPGADSTKKLAEEILSLRNDHISFLKMVPMVLNQNYVVTYYDHCYPSHNQYPDLKLFTIPDRADFRKVLSEIQTNIIKKVQAMPDSEAHFPLSGRKSGIFIFHLIGDGTAHAMGLKYTFLSIENRGFWSFFDPSSGEVLIDDDQFIQFMLADFHNKRYDTATAYTFHQVIGFK